MKVIFHFCLIVLLLLGNIQYKGKASLLSINYNSHLLWTAVVIDVFYIIDYSSYQSESSSSQIVDNSFS